MSDESQHTETHAKQEGIPAEIPRFINKEGEEFEIESVTVYDSPAWFLDQLDKRYAPFVEKFAALNQEGEHIFEEGGAAEQKAWRSKKKALYDETCTAHNYVTAFLIDVATGLVLENEHARGQEPENNSRPVEEDKRDLNSRKWILYNTPHSFAQAEVPEGIRLNPLGEVIVFEEDARRVQDILTSCGDDPFAVASLVVFHDTPISDKDRLLLSLALEAKADLLRRGARMLWQKPELEASPLPENYRERVAYLKSLRDKADHERKEVGEDLPSLTEYRYVMERKILEGIAEGFAGDTIPGTKTLRAYQGWTADQAKALLQELDNS